MANKDDEIMQGIQILGKYYTSIDARIYAKSNFIIAQKLENEISLKDTVTLQELGWYYNSITSNWETCLNG